MQSKLCFVSFENSADKCKLVITWDLFVVREPLSSVGAKPLALLLLTTLEKHKPYH